MSKAKDNNEDHGAASKANKKKKKTGEEAAKVGGGGGGGGGGGPIGGGQFIGSESSSSNRGDASLLPPPPPSYNVQLQGNDDNSCATDNSFLYSADETYNDPTKKKNKNKKTRAKIQKSKDDDDDENNRERVNISEVSRSFDGFGESDWTEEEEEADGHRDSLRRMGERLDAGVAASSSSAFVDGTDKGQKKSSAADDSKAPPRAKVSLDKFGKLFRKFKRGNQANAAEEDAEKATLTAYSTSMTSGYPESETTARHNPPTAATGGPPPSYRPPQQLTAQPRGGGGGGEDGQGMGEKERVMKERERRISNRKICESVLVTVVLVLGFVLGIVLTALSSFGLVFQIVGPTILGLSAFGLVGKVFVTVFWQEDPYLWTKRKFRRIASRHQRNQKTTKAPASASSSSAAAAAAAAVELHTISSGQRSPQAQGLSFSLRISDDNSEF